MKTLINKAALATTTAIMLLVGVSFNAQAGIAGISGDTVGGTQTFNLEVSAGSITTPDGDSFTIWGYGEVGAGGAMQYPGPTLLINQGNTVVINLTNQLPNLPGTAEPMPVSMIFPGQANVSTASSGVNTIAGLLTQESKGIAAADTVTYTFDATNAGTYAYQSGTRPGLQVEMGLMGAMIVRPTGFDPANPRAYEHADSAYDREYLFILSEMDPSIHYLAELGDINSINNASTKAVLWFINGRNGPDTLFPDGPGALPGAFQHQPYGALAQMHPGEKLLLRVISAGREVHPFHTHGNNYTLIAQDGRMRSSGDATLIGADLALSDYTLAAYPGSTSDAIFEWTGKGMDWDIYGHTAADGITCTPDGTGYDAALSEWCADHEKPLPVVMPENQSLTFGGFWRGSPFLGAMGGLPPGEGGLNVNAGMVYMWHSHTEKELANNDIFPGGMLTMLIIQPPGVTIP